MKAFIVLFGLVSMTMAHPSIIQLSPQSIHASAAASASSLSSPQRLVQIIPGLPIGSNSRLIDTIEVHISNTGHEVVNQDVQTNVKNAERISRIISTSAVALVGPDGQVIDTIGVNLAKARHAIAQRNERIRLANQGAQATAAQAQAQQQIISGPNSLLTATRQAQSIASINPTGASSVSSAQVIESPQANAARIAQQEALAAATTRQALRLPANRPLFIGLDGHLVAESPLILA